MWLVVVWCVTNVATKQVDIDKDLTTLLKYLYLIKLEKVDDQFFTYYVGYDQVINKIIDYYYEYHLGFKSNTKKVFSRAAQ